MHGRAPGNCFLELKGGKMITDDSSKGPIQIKCNRTSIFFFCIRKIFGGKTQRWCQRQHFSVSLYSSSPGYLGPEGQGPAGWQLEESARRIQRSPTEAGGKSGGITALSNENVTKARQTRISRWRSLVRMTVRRRSREALQHGAEGHSDTEQKDPALKAEHFVPSLDWAGKVDQTANCPGDAVSVVPLKDPERSRLANNHRDAGCLQVLSRGQTFNSPSPAPAVLSHLSLGLSALT